MSNCTTIPTTPQQAEDNIPNILQSMGAQACKSTTGYVYANASLAGIVNAAAGAGFNTNTGCDQINIISQNMMDAQNQINCVLNQNSVQSSSTATAIENIQLLNYGTIACPAGFNLSQSTNINFNVLNQINSAMTTQITNIVQDKLQNSFNQMASSKNGYAASPTGQKQVTNINNYITSNAFSQTVNKNVTEIMNSVLSTQNMVIDNYGTIQGNDCNINQNTLISMAAKNIVSTTIGELLKNQDVQDFLLNAGQAETQENKGAESLLPKGLPPSVVVILIILALVLGGGYFANKFVPDNKYIRIALFIGFIILVILIGYEIKKSFSKIKKIF